MARRLAFQFKITLENIEPLIWRKIQVSDLYSFWDLHVAIQDAMGWWDYHLHHFITQNPQTGKKEYIGIPEYIYGDEAYDEEETLPGWDLKIRDYFNMENRFMEYEYDFGDSWEHVVEFEDAVTKDEKARYPRCIGGERKCPPEDVGGTDGFQRYLRAMSNPTDEEHEEYLEWRGPFDPQGFNYKNVSFDNPKQRWKKAFMQENDF